MSDYIEELEKRNEELQRLLAEAEKDLIKRDNNTNRRMPRWMDKHNRYNYGWDCRNIATITKVSTDKDNPWRVWIAGDDTNETGPRKFKNVEDAFTLVELTFSNAAVPK